jgi:hypothetical protein
MDIDKISGIVGGVSGLFAVPYYVHFYYITFFQKKTPPVSTKEGLRVEQATCGTSRKSKDVTAFFQSKISGDTLSAMVSQPFVEFGGDPDFDQVKKLTIDYRFNGIPYRLSLDEKSPVAFSVNLPSSDAMVRTNTTLQSAIKQNRWISMAAAMSGIVFITSIFIQTEIDAVKITSLQSQVSEAAARHSEQDIDKYQHGKLQLHARVGDGPEIVSLFKGEWIKEQNPSIKMAEWYLAVNFIIENSGPPLRLHDWKLIFPGLDHAGNGNNEVDPIL